MHTAILIPARYQSKRYPGKPLAELTGAHGTAKSLIRRSWERARAVAGVDHVVVATDDDRIAEHCAGFGAVVAMTPADCANGTERCAAAAGSLDTAPEVVVNFQGDAPLTPAHVVETLLQAMRDDPGIAVATPVVRCDATMLAAFEGTRRQGGIGETSAVFDRQGRALYFSKEILPTRRADAAELATPVFQHMGIYAYRTDALTRYGDWPVGRLEAHEGLEQLRFLENGHRVQCCAVDLRGQPVHELNNPDDKPRIEAVLRDHGID
ncbi:3-deoxy-manno-octulosonate cytidylyltransferase [Rhodovibrio sodomensis]|uniref:3-deoxy-manno-octulosonate cytidylyltransferase n=1 Tax=Rhodovibrio sodomensis TaxID=1088 RepID=A0ABS1DI03_9PROT|nr:manno-octulosonate cytidylyltransferase [Rhodovibrio sodomensis]MBK1670111.1 3-deoxy-manno-octulosonate cytidylyltransferase [Rhodovibrio sodomensis]